MRKFILIGTLLVTLEGCQQARSTSSVTSAFRNKRPPVFNPGGARFAEQKEFFRSYNKKNINSPYLSDSIKMERMKTVTSMAPNVRSMPILSPKGIDISKSFGAKFIDSVEELEMERKEHNRQAVIYSMERKPPSKLSTQQSMPPVIKKSNSDSQTVMGYENDDIDSILEQIYPSR